MSRWFLAFGISLALGPAAFWSPRAFAFSFAGSADILTEPDNFYSWDGSEITWKLDQSFLSGFPNIKLHNQVRLAFKEWSIASSSVPRRNSPRYQWVRYNGERAITDLRSTITHELGHVLGSQHPDASWFNNNLQKNYRYQNGELIEAPPIGGEIMNEGNEPDTLPEAKPPKGIPRGAYWRTLSKDELLFLDYAYGRSLTFKEVFGNASAQIVVTAFSNSDSNVLGQAGVGSFVLRDPNDPTKGQRITTGVMGINATPKSSVHGIDTSLQTWKVKNKTGKRLARLTIRTEGTSNPQPLLIYFGSENGNFSEYEPANTSGPFAFENVGHVFSRKPGKFIKKNGFFNVGLQQDVWDWYVTGATAVSTQGDVIPLSLMTFVPFYQMGNTPPDGAATSSGDANAIIEQAEPPTVLARGIKLVNSDKAVTVSAIGIAPVGENINARDAHFDTWKRLKGEGRTDELRFEPFTVEAGEEFYVLFEGDTGALPREVIASGNYVVFENPRLLDQKFIGWAQTSDGEFEIDGVALINDEPISGHGR